MPVKPWRILAYTALSERSRRLHDMPVAIERYREVYESLAAAVPENVP